jgi:hypothetical protein
MSLVLWATLTEITPLPFPSLPSPFVVFDWWEVQHRHQTHPNPIRHHPNVRAGRCNKKDKQ